MNNSEEVRLYRCPIKITLRSPFTTSGMQTEVGGNDLSILRDHLGNVILSGYQLAGYIKIILTQIATALDGQDRACDLPDLDDLQHWYHDGRQTEAYDENAINILEDRALIRIFDCQLENQNSKINGSTTRIKINDETGSNEQGSLQVIELIDQHGSELTFEGSVRFFGTASGAKRLHRGMNVAPKFIRAFGSMKSIGHGKSISIRIQPWQEVNGASLKPPKSARKIDGKALISVKPKEPLLVEPEIHNENIYVGREEISGGLIKGTIARQLALAGCLNEYSECLSKMRINHALPAPVSHNDRPFCLPKSAIIIKSAQDAYLSDLTMIDVANLQADIVPAPGHKSEDLRVTEQQFRPTGLRKYLRNRTGVSAENWTAASGILFSQQYVVADDNHWLCEISLPPDLDDDDALHGRLAELVAMIENTGLLTLGKSQAEADCVLVKVQPHAANVQLSPAEQRVEARIVLQSDSWLLDSDQLSGIANWGNSAQSYENYFLRAFNLILNHPLDGLVLEKHFASEILVGGDKAVRFREGGSNSEEYMPYMMTSKGSVFVLSVPEAAAPKFAEAVKTFLSNGLPVPVSGRDWQDCPFVPENGYGEIMVGSADIATLGGSHGKEEDA
ncbi:MAG: hypothetical protein GY761_06805 [Hyphomicrobiales bacterium]|nr:hypothetical protein [Hyphomicrobiales bacterium]